MALNPAIKATKQAWLNETTGDIHSPAGRLVWPRTVLVAKSNPRIAGSQPKHGCALLIPKDADVSVIVADIAAAAEAKHGKDWKRKKVRLPFGKTSDEPRLAEYATEFPYILRASSNPDYKPFVIGPDNKPFRGDPSEIYGGRWAVIAGRAWGYNTGSDGVGWNLNRVQLRDQDEPIGNARVETSEGFEPIEVSSPSIAPKGGPDGGETVTADSLWG